MRRIFSSGDPARIARRHNLRRGTGRRRVSFPMSPPDCPGPTPSPRKPTRKIGWRPSMRRR